MTATIKTMTMRPLWLVLTMMLAFSFRHNLMNTKTNLASAFVVLPFLSSTSRMNAKAKMIRFEDSFAINNNSNDEKYSFEAMTRFADRLSVLEEEAPDFLSDYFEPNILSFSIAPGTQNQKLSVTSTVYGLRALAEYPTMSLARKVLGTVVDSTRNLQDGPLRNQIRALVHSGWRDDDLLDISLIVSVILKLDPTLEVIQTLMVEDDTVAQKFGTMIEKVISGRPSRQLGEDQLFSAYINYLCATVYVDLANTMNRDPDTHSLRLGVLSVQTATNALTKKETSKTEPDVVALELNDSEFFFKEITIAVSRSAEIARDELCRQLAYRAAGDTGNFDVIKLVYNLLTYVKATENLKGNTIIAPIAKTVSSNGDGDGDSDDELEDDTIMVSVPKINRRLVSAALKVFFEEQDISDGLWDRGQPIYKSFKRRGRNVGNAYVFGIDALGSLLDVLGDGNAEAFRPYLPNLERALEWIERNVDIETSVIAEECNADTGRCYGRALRGWSSPHLSPSMGPNAWSTAQTVTCLARMSRIVKELLHNDVLEEFGGISISSKNLDRNAAWDRLLDSDLGCGALTDCRTIKSVLEERVVNPFIDAANINDPGVGATYSTVLFGSPGTAKTTITEAVAEKMGWDFVVIDTAAFLADGLTNVASRIRYVFTRLQALRRCVILFDEIEEFCLDRETPGISMESRMLTTAMLTAINDLRRTKQSIFFLATNRLRAFDAAIIRPGRFDMQLFVGTPNLEARVILLRQALDSSSSLSVGGGQRPMLPSSSLSSSHDDGDVHTVIDEEPTEQIVAIYKQFLRSTWTQDAMFMNYLEGKQFASRVASMVEKTRGAAGPSGSLLDEKELARILSQQAAVMTARGSVRDEYIAQMELSRL